MVPQGDTALSSLQICYYPFHFLQAILPHHRLGCLLPLIPQGKVQPSILEQQRKAAIGRPYSTQMQAGGAIVGLLIDKEEILFYILQVAFLEEIVQTAWGIESTAEVNGGPP